MSRSMLRHSLMAPVFHPLHHYYWTGIDSNPILTHSIDPSHFHSENNQMKITPSSVNAQIMKSVTQFIPTHVHSTTKQMTTKTWKDFKNLKMCIKYRIQSEIIWLNFVAPAAAVIPWPYDYDNIFRTVNRYVTMTVRDTKFLLPGQINIDDDIGDDRKFNDLLCAYTGPCVP